MIRHERESAAEALLGIARILERGLDRGPIVPAFGGFAFGERTSDANERVVIITFGKELKALAMEMVAGDGGGLRLRDSQSARAHKSLECGGETRSHRRPTETELLSCCEIIERVTRGGGLRGGCEECDPTRNGGSRNTVTLHIDEGERRKRFGELPEDMACDGRIVNH